MCFRLSNHHDFRGDSNRSAGELLPGGRAVQFLSLERADIFVLCHVPSVNSCRFAFSMKKLKLTIKRVGCCLKILEWNRERAFCL